MSTITKEQAQKIIDAADEVITALAGTNEDVHPESDSMLRLWDDLNDRYAPPEVVRELARIALASLEADAVAYMTYKGYLLHAADPKLAEYSEPTPLYDAPPAPVLPDELLSAMEEILRISDRDHDAWNRAKSAIAACRAAMQGKAEPVAKDFENQVLSELYHAQEKRLFKLAQRIKGPSFDKYAYSSSQAIDVLEAEIFGEVEIDNSAMLAAAQQQEVKL